MKAGNLIAFGLALEAAMTPLWLEAQRVIVNYNFSEQLFTTNTLFIEAEDADYNHGHWVITTNIGMNGPYPGGAYKNLGTTADLNYDWQATGPNGQVYRPLTGLSAGEEYGSEGNNRGYFQVTDWWTLGSNREGDWENYTRPFPTNPQPYFVFVHAASGGYPINIELDEVTSGVGQNDSVQMKVRLGNFNPGRGTSGWDLYEFFQLVDADTNIIVVTLGGTNTLRAAIVTNSDEDVDYYAFLPATSPLFTAAADTRDQIDAYLFDVPVIPPVAVAPSSIALTLNGSPVTFTAQKSGGLTTITVPMNPLMVLGSTNRITASYQDTTGKSYNSSYTFVVRTPFTHGTMFIEAEDADFHDPVTLAHAQYVTTVPIGMTGPYPGGSYLGLGDQIDLDVDWHATGFNEAFYRPSTDLGAGKEYGSAGNDRGYFQVTNWWTLGWNSVGDWENYTRPFPSVDQWYEVYCHCSSGGGPINIQMNKVVWGVGQSGANQVLETFGYIAPGRATAGWDSLEIFPMLTGPGGKPTAVKINDTTTIRATMLGNQDVDYYAFVPVTLSAATITISTQPQSQTVDLGNPAHLTVAATTTSQYGMEYQWMKNGTTIAGATTSKYVTPLFDSGIYNVVLTAPGASDLTSSNAMVTVIWDTTPPRMVSAGSLNTTNGVEVDIIFNKPLKGSTVTVPANYSLDNGATVSAARWITNSSGFTVLLPDGTSLPNRQQGVILTVSGLNPATSYHVTVQNVQDYLGNTLRSQTMAVVQSPMTWVSLGYTVTNAEYPNGVENDAFAVGTNGFNLVNGGNAFWGTEDDITMVYETVAGDFDKIAQVEWNDPSSTWARAGISARVSVNPLDAIGPTASVYQMIISDPMTKFDGAVANDQYETNRRLNPGDWPTSSNGGGRPDYPDSYVRLKRIGQHVSMFYSYVGGMGPWMPLGTTDFSTNTTAITTGTNNLPGQLFVGPTLGVENGDILSQGGTPDQQGAFASRIRDYGNMGQKPRGGATYAVGLSFGANEAGAELSANDIAGVDAVAQGYWNNIFGYTPTGAGPIGMDPIVADQNGTSVVTSLRIDVTGSGNSWASMGPRGDEDGSSMTGNDAILMTGYLDTGIATNTTVSLEVIPAALTGPGYDVILYAQAGIGGRGGAYRILDGSGKPLYDWVKAQSPVNPTGFIQVIPNSTNWAMGNFIAFTNLTANYIVVEGDTFNFPFGGPPSAPINAIQLVAPSGLIVGVIPTVSIGRVGTSAVITFTGVLQYSPTVTGPYAPITGATSPYTVTTSGFFRAAAPPR